MSQENPEIVRRYYAGDLHATPGQWAAFVERFWEPDGNYYRIRSFRESRPCHGRDEILAFFREYFATWVFYEYTSRVARLRPRRRTQPRRRHSRFGRPKRE